MLRTPLPASRLQSIFNIRPGEGSKVGLMALYAAATFGAVGTVGAVAGRALFLSGLPAGAIPYRFILPALGMVVALAVFNRLIAHHPLAAAAVPTNAILLGGMLLLRLLLETSAAGSFAVLAALVVFAEVSAALVTRQFWAYASGIFNPRDDKRFSALVSLAAVASQTGGGLLVVVLAPWLDLRNFLFLVILGLAGAIVIARRIAPTGGGTPGATAAPTASADEAEDSSIAGDLRAIRRTRLLLGVTAIVLVTALVTSTAAYQLDLALKGSYGADGAGLAVFLGLVQAGAGIVAILMELYTTGRLIERLGLVTALLLLPATIALGAVAILLTGGALWAVAVPRAADQIFRANTHVNGVSTLLLPVPAERRRRIRAILEGLASSAVVAVAGGVFLTVGNAALLPLAAWAVPVLLLAGVWIMLAIRVYPHYLLALTENIRKRRFEIDMGTVDISDAAAQVLINALYQPDPLQVVHALHFIDTAPQIDWDPYVATLLNHAAPEVRVLAIRHLGRPGNLAYVGPLADLFEAPDVEVRAAAIAAYCGIAGPQALNRIAPFLHDPDPRVKGAAVLGLMKYGGLYGILDGIDMLNAILTSPEPAMRLEGVRVIGALGVHYHRLIPLINDGHTEVEIAALRAAGALRRPELVPFLVAKLGTRGTTGVAVEALVQYGAGRQDEAGIEPFLGMVLQDTREARETRMQVTKVLRRLGTPAAATVLLRHLNEPDETLRTEIYRALARLRAMYLFPIDEAAVRRALNAESEQAYRATVLRAELGAEMDDPLLGDALAARRMRVRDRIFYLLTILYPDRSQNVESVRRSLNWDPRAMRAEAGAMAVAMLPRDLSELMTPLLKGSTDQVLEIARKRFAIPQRSLAERLEELATGPDPWLRVCALTRIAAHGLTSLTGPLRAGLHDPDPLVRETAAVAIRDLFGPAGVDLFETTLVSTGAVGVAVRPALRDLEAV
jgi:HEAT repeat protein